MSYRLYNKVLGPNGQRLYATYEAPNKNILLHTEGSVPLNTQSWLIQRNNDDTSITPANDTQIQTSSQNNSFGAPYVATVNIHGFQWIQTYPQGGNHSLIGNSKGLYWDVPTGLPADNDIVVLNQQSGKDSQIWVVDKEQHEEECS